MMYRWQGGLLAASVFVMACAQSRDQASTGVSTSQAGSSPTGGTSAAGGDGASGGGATNGTGGAGAAGGMGGMGGVGGVGGTGGTGGAGPCGPAVVPSPDLVAWYGFEDSTNPQVVDLSSYGHHGTPSTGVQRGVTGRFCKGVRFDGSLSHIDIPYSSDLDISGDITIEAWVFLDAPNQTNRMLVRKYLQYQMSVSVVPEPNLLEFYSQPLGFARTTQQVQFGKWIHAAVSHDGTTARLYIDGQLKDAVPFAGSLPSNTNSLKLGGDGFNQVAPDGGMDEVKIWRVLRSEQQICEDGNGTYSAGGTPKCTY